MADEGHHRAHSGESEVKPYYEDEKAGIVIYHGDCRGVLPSLNSFDLLLTDPPYNEVNRESGGLRVFDKGGADSLPFSVEWLPATATSVYVWCAWEQLSDHIRWLRANEYTPRAAVWHKSNPSPMNGERMWLSGVELCAFGRRSGAYFAEHCESPVWCGPSEYNPEHTTQKPLWLFKELIGASCPPNGTVLDPFMGSGTTLRAAKDLGRKAIGIEIEERYCEIAAKRLSQEVLPFTTEHTAGRVK
jgi:site-specific DNA-methyltransferase (adenine-specific)